MSINQRRSGAILSYVVIGLNIFVGLLYTPYMLRCLGQNEYGLYALVASVIGYLTILDFGFGNAIIRYTAKFKAEGREEELDGMYGMFILLYSFIGILTLFVGTILYFNVNNLFGDTMADWELSKARVLMLIMIFNVSFTFPLSVFGGIIAAYEKFVFARIVQIVRIILNSIVMVVLLSAGYKAITMAFVMTVFNLSTLVINYVYCRNKLNVKIKIKRIKIAFIQEVFIYSFWVFLNVIMDKIYWGTGQFILGSVSGTIMVSIFAVAIQLQTMYMSFSSSIASVFLPRVTEMITSGCANNHISDLFLRIGRIQNYIVLFIVLGFFAFGRSFILLWAGPEYIDSYYITLMFFIALLIPLIQNMGIVILQARNQLKFRSILYIIIAIICLIAQIPLAESYGAVGCAIAISLALLIGQGIVLNIYYHKVQKINIIQFWKEIIRISIPLVIASLGAKYLINMYMSLSSFSSLLLGVMLFSVLYWGVAFWICMNKYEKELLLSPICRLIVLK